MQIFILEEKNCKKYVISVFQFKISMQDTRKQKKVLKKLKFLSDGEKF